MHDFPKDVCSAISQVVNFKGEFVPLHEPRFLGNELEFVQDCVSSTFVSSVGKYVDKFENDLASYTGANHAVAMVNGTAALQIAMKVLGVQPNDEVLIPSLTFVATANAVKHNFSEPHFVDVSENFPVICPDTLRDWLEYVSEKRNGNLVNKFTNRRISAIVVMHCFGHVFKLFELKKVAKDFGLPLIEDSAEALGSHFNGQHAGTFGEIGVLSFNGNKIITTGGGGAIITNNVKLAKYAKYLTTTAKTPHPWSYQHDEVGFNYRMPNLNAALGCAQLESMGEFVASKRALHVKYQNEFSTLEGLDVLCEPKGATSNYWLQALVLDDRNSAFRDEILNATNERGIMTRPCWDPLHLQKPFKDCPQSPLINTVRMSEKIINVPSSAGLS